VGWELKQPEDENAKLRKLVAGRLISSIAAKAVSRQMVHRRSSSKDRRRHTSRDDPADFATPSDGASGTRARG
jgi:hypothetical protein